MRGNKEIFEKIRQQEAQLSFRISGPEGLLLKKDPLKLYTDSGKYIRPLFNAPVAAIYAFDRNTCLEVVQVVWDEGERQFPDRELLDNLSKMAEAEVIYIDESTDTVGWQIKGKDLHLLAGKVGTNRQL